MSSPTLHITVSADGKPRGIVRPTGDFTPHFDPLTTALVALQYLAEGALQYLGGKLMATILGDPSISDLDDLIKNAVIQIEAFIPVALQQALAQNDLNTLNANLSGLLTDLNQYAGYTTHQEKLTNRYLVTHAIEFTSSAIPLAAQYNLSGSFVYANAVSLRLLALAADYRLLPASGTKKEFNRTVDSSTTQISSLFPAFEAKWSTANRVSGIQWDIVPPDSFTEAGHKFTTPARYTAWCTKDGIRIDLAKASGSEPDAEAQAAYQAVIAAANSESQSAIAAVEPPLNAAVKSWAAAKQTLSE